MPDSLSLPGPHRPVSLVLAGGVALGAFEAGAYAALHESGLEPSWVAGASIGAVNAAIIAGNAPGERLGKLRAFWDSVSTDPLPFTSFWLGHPAKGPWRQTQNSAAALETFLFGRKGVFRPWLAPVPQAGSKDVTAFYDLAPLAERLPSFVDFARLNRGETRLTVSATDVESGERVVFDTGRGDTIGPMSILGSCALMPMFAPVEVEGRLLADGALSANTPLDLVLEERTDRSLCVVVDLFALPGSRPHTLFAAAARAGDLLFGNQTRRLLEAREREHRLRTLLERLAEHLPEEARTLPEVADALREGRAGRADVLHVSYRAGVDEAGAFKGFDFSRPTLTDRWQAGGRATRAALGQIGDAAPDSNLRVVAVQDGSPSTPAAA